MARCWGSSRQGVLRGGSQIGPENGSAPSSRRSSLTLMVRGRSGSPTGPAGEAGERLSLTRGSSRAAGLAGEPRLRRRLSRRARPQPLSGSRPWSVRADIRSKSEVLGQGGGARCSRPQASAALCRPGSAEPSLGMKMPLSEGLRRLPRPPKVVDLLKASGTWPMGRKVLGWAAGPREAAGWAAPELEKRGRARP